MAAESAPSHEQIWIDDTYATIFCATTGTTREESERLVARWRRMFIHPAAGPDTAVRAPAAAPRALVPERQCASGERVALGPAVKAAAPVAAPAHQPGGAGLISPVAPTAAGMTTGATTTAGGGFRAAGFVESVAKK
jgi:hypothetical protein